MDISKENKLNELIMRHLQGDNSPQEMQQLTKMLQDDAEAVELYVEYMMQFSALNQPGNITIQEFSEVPSPSMLDTSLWMALSKYEKEAPEIELPKEKPQRELIQKVVYLQREKYKMSKFHKFTLAACAAIILFFVYLNFAPQKPYNQEVATLTDSINAKWADARFSMQRGVRLYNDKIPLLLKKGFVEIKFDNNAQVTIEGPAEFQILDSDMIKLNYGRLYSQVPPEAYGFQICTRHSKVIDLGTEFGIKEGIDGDTEVHVLQGRVNLILNVLSKKINVNLLAGSARQFDAETGELKEIPCKDNLFVRQIDSKTNIIWRGQEILDLADMVGGGNGFGGGGMETGVDVTTGKITSHLLTYSAVTGLAGYRPVPNNSYIDGVFIPGADDGQTLITSDGSYTVSFPKTKGDLWGYIFNGAFHQGSAAVRNTLQLDDIIFGTPDNPAITIHSNQGITFDLSEIRKKVPGLSIAAFRSLAGVSQTAQDALEEEKEQKSLSVISPEAKKVFDAQKSKVEFWVFVDGRQVFHKEISSIDEPEQLEIPIGSNDRFLTLATTESDDAIAYDWALFGRPELILELAEPDSAKINK